MKKFILIACVSLFFAAGCDNDSDTTFAIKYVVTGTMDTADISYRTTHKKLENLYNVPLPWEHSYIDTYNNNGGMYFRLAARGNESGEITASVYVNGYLFATNTGNPVADLENGIRK